MHISSRILRSVTKTKLRNLTLVEANILLYRLLSTITYVCVTFGLVIPI